MSSSRHSAGSMPPPARDVRTAGSRSNDHNRRSSVPSSGDSVDTPSSPPFGTVLAYAAVPSERGGSSPTTIKLYPVQLTRDAHFRAKLSQEEEDLISRVLKKADAARPRNNIDGSAPHYRDPHQQHPFPAVVPRAPPSYLTTVPHEARGPARNSRSCSNSSSSYCSTCTSTNSSSPRTSPPHGSRPVGRSPYPALQTGQPTVDGHRRSPPSQRIPSPLRLLRDTQSPPQPVVKAPERQKPELQQRPKHRSILTPPPLVVAAASDGEAAAVVAVTTAKDVSASAARVMVDAACDPITPQASDSTNRAWSSHDAAVNTSFAANTTTTATLADKAVATFMPSLMSQATSPPPKFGFAVASSVGPSLASSFALDASGASADATPQALLTSPRQAPLSATSTPHHAARQREAGEGMVAQRVVSAAPPLEEVVTRSCRLGSPEIVPEVYVAQPRDTRSSAAPASANEVQLASVSETRIMSPRRREGTQVREGSATLLPSQSNTATFGKHQTSSGSDEEEYVVSAQRTSITTATTGPPSVNATTTSAEAAPSRILRAYSQRSLFRPTPEDLAAVRKIAMPLSGTSFTQAAAPQQMTSSQTSWREVPQESSVSSGVKGTHAGSSPWC